MKKYPLRNAKFLLVTLVMLGLSACSSDTDSGNGTPAQKQITFTVPESAIPDGSDLWFFVTDNNGKVLALEQAFAGSKTVITLPAGYTKAFTLHKLTYTNDIENAYTDVWIQSYTSAITGDFSIAPIVTPEAVEPLIHTFTLTDVPEGSQPNPTGPNVLGLGSTGKAGSTHTVKAALKETTGRVMYFVPSYEDVNVTPRYIIYPNAEAGQTETASYNDLTLADKINLSLGEQVESVVVVIAPLGLRPLHAYGTQNVNSIPVYYPGDEFTSYATNVQVYDGNASYGYTTIGAIPTSMKKLPASVTLFEATADQLTVHTTGNYDYLFAASQHEWSSGSTTHALDWFVYMNDDAGAFIIPDFPEELLVLYPQLSDAVINFNYLSLIESDEVAGYTGHLSKVFNPSAPASALTERFSLNIDFSSEGARGSNTRIRKLEHELSSNASF